MLETQGIRVPEALARDRRRGRRFQLQLNCRVSSPSMGFSELAGVTTDMSRTGMLVRFEQAGIPDGLSQIGGVATVAIDLPHTPNISPRYLECIVTVVRVAEVGTDYTSVAFEIHRTQVCRAATGGQS